jgi:hypothetical protein
VKTVALVIGLLIAAFGAVGILAPAGPVWIAERSVTPAVFYLVSVVRVAFGLILISVASASRAPRTLRVMGALILIAGIATALMGLLDIERARTMVDSWLRQGSGVVRLTGVLLLALGGFVAYACAPSRRTAR